MRMWMETYANHYSPTTLSMLKNYIDRKGILPSNPKNYNMIKNYMYKIGGINFAQYLEQDIEYKNNDLELIESLSKVNSLQGCKKSFIEDILKNVPLLEKLEPNLRIPAIQHIIIAAQLKASINEKENPLQIQSNLSMNYDKVMYKLKQDVTLNNFVANYAINEMIYHPNVTDKADYEQVINQIYTYKGVNLSEYIKNYSVSRVPYTYVWHGRNYSYAEIINQKYFSPLWLLGNSNLKMDGIRFQTEAATEKQDEPRKRISAELTIQIPNFRDPLLTSMTQEHRDTLYQMLQDFENIPAVLKGCNTKEIEKYKREYTKKHRKQKNIPYASNKKQQGSTR